MKKLILLFIVVLVSACVGRVETPLRITTSQLLPDCLEGSVCTYTLEAADGTRPYNWRVTDNETLPLDFVLQPTGVIRGTGSLSPGTSRSISPPFTVIVADSAGNNATASLTINVVENVPKIVALPIEPIFVGSKCNVPIVSATGGTPPYSFQQATMREGFVPMGTFVDVNGSLRGTPTKEGNYVFGVTVADRVRKSARTTVTVIVLPSQDVNLTVRWVGLLAGAIYWDRGAKGECTRVADDIYQCVSTQQRGTVVTFTQTPNEGTKFKSWSGACSGAGECKVTMDSDKTVSAEWEADDTVTVVTPTPQTDVANTFTVASVSCTLKDKNDYTRTYTVKISGTATGLDTWIQAIPLNSAPEGHAFYGANWDCDQWSESPTRNSCSNTKTGPASTNWVLTGEISASESSWLRLDTFSVPIKIEQANRPSDTELVVDINC